VHSARQSLDEFIVGPCNRLAHEAARRLADPHEEPGFRLLVVHGSCGVGKTHLLGGLADRFRALAPGSKVWWTTAEAFTNQYIASIRANRADAFRRRVRAVDLICVDDVHFFAGKNSTQSEFLHTIDALEHSGARIALATDAHPRQLERLEQRFISRCLSGMVVEVREPERETRLRILSELTRRRGIEATLRALELLEQWAGPTVRDLEGAITSVDLVRRATRSDSPTIDPGMVRTALAHADTRPVAQPVRLNTILTAACSRVGVSEQDVLGKGRHKRVVLARSLAAHLARELTTHSFPEIARGLGRANHSTVIAACQRVEKQIVSAAPCACGPDLEGLNVSDLCALVRRDVTGSGARVRRKPAPAAV
jgi:chromosomal replication initiator protein